MAVNNPHKRPNIMRKALPTLLIIAGLVLVVLGFIRKDEGQAEIDLGRTEITLGKSDSAFSPYFIVGGLLALSGVVLVVSGSRKS